MSENSENDHSFGGFFPEKQSDISKPKISMGVPFGTEIQETYQDIFSFDEKHSICLFFACSFASEPDNLMTF